MIIIGIIEFIALFIAVLFLANIRIDLLKLIVGFILILIPSLIGFFYFSQGVGIIVLFVGLSFLFYILAKTKWVLIDVCIVMMLGILADNISQFLQNKPIGGHDSIIMHIILFNCVFSALIVLYKVILKRKMTYVYLSFVNQLIIIVLIIVTVAIFYINVFVLHTKMLVIINIAIQLLYLSLIILLFSLLLRTTKKEYMVKQKEILQQHFSEYTKALAKVNEDMQKFRHDYMNILLSIRGYLDEKNIDGLTDYFYTYIIPTEQQTLFRNKMFGVLEKLEVLDIKSIIASKMIQAERENIEVNLEIPQQISQINIDPIDLTRVIGIYLDNAIEASENIKNPCINMAFFQNTEENIIIIENKCNPDNLHLDKLFNKSFSTKGEQRGLGLLNARSILNKYDHITMNTRIEKDWFIQEIQIDQRS
ncbi:GHKL domain-containing protein [Schinkia azotoformans]|uniref:Accessory protein regulator C n=1 Tax=Schinkia azotoformans LMG 9581 TaxID=1131731 RepID=K6DPZ6_SCHAZ|nr:GHKL domain-containing protein [Schinkia azotoformans]EKN62856.1 accessory protein regulator C [Schinkia azotoformans LMG 9581]MEC1641095.1 GHKL domain-containing protein [Schinkia azotoformans]MEC1720564.1 GHKL domain-containing protein [Schinkia azotoformans]MEC1945063.1 GHKL domain-containing protein [Schinkia azotoformans]MED4414100.1 GHKL domain-containing protein [Schinkia azotoformans]